MQGLSALVLDAAPLAAILASIFGDSGSRMRAACACTRSRSPQALTEPASLHRRSTEKRLGCGACVEACPEQPHHEALGRSTGKPARGADWVAPSTAPGKVVCPFDAITSFWALSAGAWTSRCSSRTSRPTFPASFVAGELGGMGLIRNALMQGQQALEAIAKGLPARRDALDVLIVGAGPAGLAASLAAKRLGLKYLTLEQDSLGGAVFQYPRGKLVMTSPVELPLVGKVHFRNTSKEDLLKFWTDACKPTASTSAISSESSGSSARTGAFRLRRTARPMRRPASCSPSAAAARRASSAYPARSCRKWCTDSIDPEQYRGQRIVVVGGGDSALEAAASIAELGDAKVVLSYRGDAFQRAKQRIGSVSRRRGRGALEVCSARR